MPSQTVTLAVEQTKREIMGIAEYADALYEISRLKVLIHQLYDNVCSAYRDERIESLDKANVIEERIAGHLINVAKTIRSLKTA